MWEAEGYVIPNKITEDELNKVLDVFSKPGKESYESKVNWDCFFVQQVYKGDSIYVAGNGANEIALLVKLVVRVEVGELELHHRLERNPLATVGVAIPPIGGIRDVHLEEILSVGNVYVDLEQRLEQVRYVLNLYESGLLEVVWTALWRLIVHPIEVSQHLNVWALGGIWVSWERVEFAKIWQILLGVYARKGAIAFVGVLQSIVVVPEVFASWN